jgi:hypothetical protein
MCISRCATAWGGATPQAPGRTRMHRHARMHRRARMNQRTHRTGVSMGRCAGTARGHAPVRERTTRERTQRHANGRRANRRSANGRSTNGRRATAKARDRGGARLRRHASRRRPWAVLLLLILYVYALAFALALVHVSSPAGLGDGVLPSGRGAARRPARDWPHSVVSA